MPTLAELDAMTAPTNRRSVSLADLDVLTAPSATPPPLVGRAGELAVRQGLQPPQPPPITDADLESWRQLNPGARSIPDTDLAAALASRRATPSGTFREYDPLTGAAGFARNFGQEMRQAVRSFPPTTGLVDPDPIGLDFTQQQPGEGLGGFFGSAIGSAVRSAPALAFGPAGGIVALAPMVAEAGGRRAAEVARQGGSEFQQITSGVGAGVSEAATEFIPIPFLKRLAAGGAGSIGRRAIQALGIAGVEGSEEVANTIATNTIDAMNGVQTWEQASENIVREAPLAFAGGAVGGLAVSAPVLIGTSGRAVKPAGSPQPVAEASPEAAAAVARDTAKPTPGVLRVDDATRAETAARDAAASVQAGVQDVPEPSLDDVLAQIRAKAAEIRAGAAAKVNAEPQGEPSVPIQAQAEQGADGQEVHAPTVAEASAAPQAKPPESMSVAELRQELKDAGVARPPAKKAQLVESVARLRTPDAGRAVAGVPDDAGGVVPLGSVVPGVVAGREEEQKQPWEMTRSEYIGQQPDRLAVPVGNSHEMEVRRAIRRGEPVPKNVLADYPDLVQPQPEEASSEIAAKQSPADDYETIEVEEETDAAALGISQAQFDAIPDQGVAVEQDDDGVSLKFTRPATLAEGRALKKAGWERDTAERGRYVAVKATEEPPAASLPLNAEPGNAVNDQGGATAPEMTTQQDRPTKMFGDTPVYVDQSGVPLYVMADESKTPIAFQTKQQAETRRKKLGAPDSAVVLRANDGRWWVVGRGAIAAPSAAASPETGRAVGRGGSGRTSITDEQAREVDADIARGRRKGEQVDVYRDQRGRVVVATKYDKGVFNVIIEKDGTRNPIGSGPIESVGRGKRGYTPQWTKIERGAEPKPDIASKLSDIESAARSRRASRKIKRGKNIGATTLPDDVVDFIIETAAGAAKDGIITARAIREYVASRIPESIRERLDQIVGRVTRIISSALSDDKKIVLPSRLNTALGDFLKNPDVDFGRPDLANPGATPGARAFVDAVDEARNRAGEPQTKADVETKRKADLIEDEEAEKTLRRAAKTGDQLSDEQTNAAKRVVDKAAREAMNPSASKSDRFRAAELVDAYRRTGTEQARAFRQRRDETLSPVERQRNTLIQYATEPTPQLAERIDELTERIKKASESEQVPLLEQRRRLIEQYADENEKVSRALADIGLNPATMTEGQLSDRRTAARVVRTINSAKSTPWHWALEWWINAILSGPRTQIVNAVGNASYATWDLTAQRLTEATVNMVAGDPNAAQIGEIKAAWRAFLPSLSRAGQNFLLAFDTEMPVFADDIARVRGEPGELLESDKLDRGRARYAIPGKAGRIIRIPSRTLLATDELFKTIVGTMEANANAYRLALQEGLKGEAAYTRVGELVADLASPVWDAGLEEARRTTFQSDIGKLGKGVLRIRNDYPALTFILPFITTPANIFKAGLRKTPLSVFLTMHRAASHGLVKMGYSKSGWHYERKQVVRDIADNLIGVALLAALLPFVGGEDEKPLITGSIKPTSAPSQSIRIGDTWVSYARVQPFAAAISMTVDIANSIKGNTASPLPEQAWESLKGQVRDQPFMSGLSDVMELFQEGAPGMSDAGRFASNFVSGWVPNIVRQVAAATDPSVRETRVWGSPKEAAFWERAAIRSAQRSIPLAAVAPQPKIDLWGREISAKDIGNPIADFLYRSLVPFNLTPDTSTKPDRVIARWNAMHPDAMYAPRPPSPMFTREGKRIPMSDEQYAAFCRAAGSAALKRLEAATLDETEPTKRDMDKIKAVIEEERAKARRAVE